MLFIPTYLVLYYLGLVTLNRLTLGSAERIAYITASHACHDTSICTCRKKERFFIILKH